MLKARLIALAALWVASSAQANLMVGIYEHTVPGQTLWVFSGSAEYSELVAGGKIAGGDLLAIEEWKGAAVASNYVQTGAYDNYSCFQC